MRELTVEAVGAALAVLGLPQPAAHGTCSHESGWETSLGPYGPVMTLSVTAAWSVVVIGIV